jgi:hypothetical protein
MDFLETNGNYIWRIHYKSKRIFYNEKSIIKDKTIRVINILNQLKFHIQILSLYFLRNGNPIKMLIYWSNFIQLNEKKNIKIKMKLNWKWK